MIEENISTEEKILLAAEEIFIRDGFDGARMQEIADKAGINKAMLHYYFRSKDKLFTQIFVQKFQTFIPKIAAEMHRDSNFVQKIHFFIAEYMKMLIQNPFIPNFILNTANRNPDIMKMIDMQFPKMMFSVIEQEIEKGNLQKVNALQFIVSVMGMCVMPFAGKPLLKHVLGLNEADFQTFLAERTAEIQQYVSAILTRR